MSYCRFGNDSDFYIWSDGAKYNCIGEKHLTFVDLSTLKIYLLEQKALGKKIPKSTFERINRELMESEVARVRSRS